MVFSPTLLAVIVLAALSAGAVAYAVLFGRIENEKKTKRRFARARTDRANDRVAARIGIESSKRRKSIQETIKELEKEGKSKSDKNISIGRRIEQAGLSFSRRTFYIASAAAGLVALVISLVAGLPVYAVVVAALAGSLGLPRWVINKMRKRRLKKFQEEFANAIDVIVRGVKAGLPLNDCLQIAARETEDPVRSEFQRVVEAQKVGVSTADAIDRMPENIPIAEVNFFAIVIGIQQRVGGNLSEALSNLSNVLRERKRMTGKIKAMSMEAKASGVIIAALPFIVMVLVYITSPDYIMVLFTDKLGNMLLGAAAIWMTMGVLVMRKMINFDY